MYPLAHIGKLPSSANTVRAAPQGVRHSDRGQRQHGARRPTARPGTVLRMRLVRVRLVRVVLSTGNIELLATFLRLITGRIKWWRSGIDQTGLWLGSKAVPSL